MSNNIYHTEKHIRLRAAIQKAAGQQPEFTYRHDPDFIGFCTAIRQEVELEQITRDGNNGPEPDSVRMNKLYGVWYMSKTFRTHWQHPTKRSENDILWILYHRGWSFAQGGVAVIAWWRIHHRTITGKMLQDLYRLSETVWDQVQNEKMKQTMEAKRNSLRNRIVWFLQQQPATTAFLARKLKATSKAVDSHLYRLRKEKIVVRQSWGLYALATSTRPDADLTHTAAMPNDPPEPQPNSVTGTETALTTKSWSLDDVDDGVAESRRMPSTSYCEARSVAPDDFEWNAPSDLPTAEPRWRRM